MTEVFEIQYPPTPAGRKVWTKRFGMNAYYAGKHWSQRKEDAQYWHALTHYEMTRQKVRRRPFENPVIITFYWNDRLDCSNHCAMAKMIEDAMVAGRVINGDSRRWVKGIEHYFHDRDCIRVEVREIERRDYEKD